MNAEIHINAALKEIWTGKNPFRIGYFKTDGTKGEKAKCIHPINEDQHFKKPAKTTFKTHVKGRHLLKLMNLEDGKIFFLKIPLLT